MACSVRARGSAGARPERTERTIERRPAQGGELGVKVPMPDLVNEVVCIAAALVDHDARKRLLTLLSIDNFFGRSHPEIWTIVTELERRGLAYDPATVRQLSGATVDTDYLDSLIQQRPVAPPNLDHHIDVMRWDRARVEGIRGPVAGFLEALRDPQAPPERVRALARQVGGAFDHGGALAYLRDPQGLVTEQRDVIRRRRAGHAVYPFGIDGFDVYADGPNAGQYRAVPGTAPGKITVVTGVPGSGKTQVTNQIVLAQVEQQRRVLYGAWEMGSGMSLESLAQRSLRISRTRLQIGQITDEEEAALGQEMERLAGWVRFFEIPFGAKPEKKQRLTERNLDLIHEYLELIRPDVFVADLWRRAVQQLDPDEEELALYRQQAMASTLKVHCILLHQQNMKILESRVDKQPSRETLKGSGAWVEVPDTLIGTHRDALFKSVPDDTQRLILMKQRFGVWPLAVDCSYDPETGLIWDGRCAEYDRPGAAGALDTFLDDSAAKKSRGKKVS
jgi:replicative DNA helicase